MDVFSEAMSAIVTYATASFFPTQFMLHAAICFFCIAIPYIATVFVAVLDCVLYSVLSMYFQYPSIVQVVALTVPLCKSDSDCKKD